MNISKTQAQRRLIVAWLVGTTVLALFFMIQTLATDKYGEHTKEALDWLLPNVFPTLTMMLGALVVTSRRTYQDGPTVDVFYYRLTFGLLVLYFLVMLFVVATMSADYLNTQTTPLQHLYKATPVVSAFHGMVTLVLGIFFANQATASDEKSPKPAP